MGPHRVRGERAMPGAQPDMPLNYHILWWAKPVPGAALGSRHSFRCVCVCVIPYVRRYVRVARLPHPVRAPPRLRTPQPADHPTVGSPPQKQCERPYVKWDEFGYHPKKPRRRRFGSSEVSADRLFTPWLPHSTKNTNLPATPTPSPRSQPPPLRTSQSALGSPGFASWCSPRYLATCLATR